MRAIPSAAALLLMGSLTVATAFDGHRVTEGPLALSIDPPPTVTEYDQPVSVRVRLENHGKAALTGVVEIRDLVDEWRVVGQARQPFALEDGQVTTLSFCVAAGKGTYAELYPIHVYARFKDGQQKRIAHAVHITEPKLRLPDASLATPPSVPVVTVPGQGAFPLWRTRAYRVAWQHFDKPLVYKPVGWKGSDARSRASLTLGGMANRGGVREVIGMHPPWAPNPGTLSVAYHLALPKTTPLYLTFANAIRDPTDAEPPSDGVTFRVWLVRAEESRCLFERHTDAKTWQPGRIDLSEFAGQTVYLRLETHPGPKRNTTCDQAYWAEPTIVAGAAPPLAGGPARQAAIRRIAEALGVLATAPAPPTGQILQIDQGALGGIRLPVRHGYVLGIGPDHDRCVVLVQPGRRGLIDGLIGLGYADGKTVVFDGLPLQVNGNAVGEWSSAVAYERCDRRIGDGRLVAVHRLGDRRGPFDLTISLWSDGPGLRIKFDCAGDPAGKADAADPRRITDLSLGPANVKASRVYYGHGYCIENPKGFGAHFGGHNMSTSHVGFDFETGIALIQAVDNPPDRLEVRPDQRRYQLHTHMNATLTLVASRKGAFDCAIKYRDLYDKPAAGGVQRLAGRFTYDIWWSGSFADIARQMARQIRYGCTDAILTLHVWQRWGYDYRLPDIFPPNPKMGTVEDLRRIGELCRKHDIPWGLHDNYTDFYPDATGYTYDHVCFGRDGTPRKAWFNVGRRAQSYRWRADRFVPFLQRNLKRIKPALNPSHYFIDVFSSIGCYDFYDRQGRFHPKLETRRRWGEAFTWIRDYLGDAAPTTSEAGHDQLVGCLDGADCQFLTLSTIPRPTRFMITMRCDDWERTPWYDAVLHDKFILHGVGYCNRYRAGRPRGLHGIASDDYITAEVLTGHPAMVDATCWGAAAVRKYWLLQDIARNLALRHIRSVTFADDDIHRQQVTWDNGTRVWVNRGRSDWTVHGHVLPQYGYLVEGKGLFSAIERLDGVIVEHTRGPVGVYCNARTLAAKRVVKARPAAEGVEYLGGRRFRLVVRWDVLQAPPAGLQVFVHFLSPKSKRREQIAFQGGHSPDPPTETWQGVVRTGRDRIVEIPAAWGPGTYDIVLGLYSDEQGRQRLLGREQGSMRYRIGTLGVEGKGGKIANVRLKPPTPPAESEEPRLNLEKRRIDFGPLIADGACRVQRMEGGVRIIPLPDSPPFSVRLRPQSLGDDKPAAGAMVAVLDESGQTVRSTPVTATNGDVSVTHDGRAFCYEVQWKPAR